MLYTTVLFSNGKYQTNLVECKDLRGLATQFHFEVIDKVNCKCIGIFDRVSEAKSAMDKQAEKIREDGSQVKAG